MIIINNPCHRPLCHLCSFFARIYVDGVEYIDYCGSWGALIHGHCEPSILAAASDYMARGTTFGITTEIEGAIARKIVDLSSIHIVRA